MMTAVLILGVIFLASAVLNWDWYYFLLDVALVDAVLGERACRWVCGLTGVALIAVGWVGRR